MASKGRYRHLRKKLPKAPAKPPSWFKDGEQKWAERVDQAKRELIGGAENPEDASAGRLGAMIVDARLAKRRHQEEERRDNVVIEALTQLIWHVCEVDGIEKVGTASGVTISLKDEPYGSVEDEEKFFKHMIDSGQTNLLSLSLSDDLFSSARAKQEFFDKLVARKLLRFLSVNGKTMQSLVKESALAEKRLPGVKVFNKRGLNFSGVGALENGDE